MNYKDLLVWQNADELALAVYEGTRGFPKEVIFGITSQLRRAALSVPTNIVEGYGRKGDKELARFVSIALGSLAETEYLMEFSGKLHYLQEEKYQNLERQRNEVGKLLWNFYQKVSKGREAGKRQASKMKS